MGESTVNLATLIGSRICHDLISPIGAINNGLELLEMTGAPSGPEMDLISDSVDSAGARIQFFRIAYGIAGAQMLGGPEIRSVLKEVNRGARVTVDWTHDDPCPRTVVRLAFLAFQCCETALPQGGQVRFDKTGGRWTVTATGPVLSLDPKVWETLSNPAAGAEITPALVQFALLPAAATELGNRVEVTSDEAQITIRF
ncbi:histidine phosphotransferase family protein [Ruegeria sp. 2012CJ41-6]|uniref:Histidine phosphotransferase family protein n=1 Tax=Ruegeria spongiae TaxID=2942209 RepID=A0ABT0PX63_9RHOB|nr:histidine phosphotransferase family protein [Ruegeria spongiae]MCL6282112.1 histidine phosphotransferase family protein [Ruegeria spongiae]